MCALPAPLSQRLVCSIETNAEGAAQERSRAPVAAKLEEARAQTAGAGQITILSQRMCVSCQCIAELLMYFVIAAAARSLELTDKFLQLKQSGKLNDYIAKKRKKNAAKDHRWVSQ